MPRFVHFIYLIPLLFSAILSLKSFRLRWPEVFRLFSIFLFATLFTELFAIAWKLYLYKTPFWNYSKSNAWIYNIYLVPEYLFYFLFYFSVLKSNLVKKFIIIFSVIYAVGGIINLIFIQTLFNLNTYNIIAGNLTVLFLSLNYFHQSIKENESIENTREPLFWISIGVFVFNTASLPYFTFLNYLSKNNIALAIALFNILLALNILMYSFYLIAFLCSKTSLK